MWTTRCTAWTSRRWGRVGGHDLVHEVEKLQTPPALGVGGGDLAGGHVEGRERGECAVALVVVAVAAQGPAVRQLQIALRPLQGTHPVKTRVSSAVRRGAGIKLLVG